MLCIKESMKRNPQILVGTWCFLGGGVSSDWFKTRSVFDLGRPNPCKSVSIRRISDINFTCGPCMFVKYISSVCFLREICFGITVRHSLRILDDPGSIPPGRLLGFYFFHAVFFAS